MRWKRALRSRSIRVNTLRVIIGVNGMAFSNLYVFMFHANRLTFSGVKCEYYSFKLRLLLVVFLLIFFAPVDSNITISSSTSTRKGVINSNKSREYGE